MKLIQTSGLLCALAPLLTGAGNAQSTAEHGATHGAGGAHSLAATQEECASPVRRSAGLARGAIDAVDAPSQDAAAPGGKEQDTTLAASEAHEVHGTQFGGYAFFMAPDKLHHLEALYTDECGFRLVVFDAFTEPMGVAHFRGFIRVSPGDQSQPEVLRFLSPSPDGTLLEARFSDPPPRPFEVELYLEFPESPDPELFNITVPAQSP